MNANLSRRALLGGGLAVAGVALLSRGGRAGPAALPARTLAPASGERRLSLVAAERSARLLGPDGPETPVWTYGEKLLDVIRIRQGETIVAELDNRLPEHSSIHWHGLRIPNDQDGVPYVTQPPVRPGERHEYRFTPPDTGTYWLHPHCDTIAQLGRGLANVLIVEGDETTPYAADHVLVLKDWRLDEETGAYLPFSTKRGALRAGTFGTVRSVNGGSAPRLSVPAGGDVRLRLVNVDSTRVGDIGVEGAEAAVIAIDGNPVAPFPLKSWRLGPAMRLDVVVRAPRAGAEARLKDFFAAEPVTLATLAGEGEEPARARAFDPAPLSRSSIPEPKTKGAERLSFAFATASKRKAQLAVKAEDDPLAAAMLDSLCAANATNWTINREAWPSGDHSRLPKPLAILTTGRSYVAELSNETPHVHPIHLHGFTFKVLKSTRRDLPVHFADTVLLTPKERITIAFVADRPGDWMIHCHLIEHQDTGMMGYIKVA